MSKAYDLWFIYRNLKEHIETQQKTIDLDFAYDYALIKVRSLHSRGLITLRFRRLFVKNLTAVYNERLGEICNKPNIRLYTF